MKLPLLLDSVEIVSRDNGSYVDGSWVEGSTTTSASMKANVQRCTAQEIQRLPEGFRSQEVLKVFLPASADVDLLINDTVSPAPSFIIYNGNTYAIIDSEKWNHLLPHWRLTVVDRNPT